MGKSTINGPFSIAMLVYQRVLPWLYLEKKQKNQFHGYNPNEHKKVGVFLGWSLNSMGFSKQTVGFVWIPRSHPSSP